MTSTTTYSIKNYYVILGVNNDATNDEIKGAYRKLARKYHADKKKNYDEQKWQDLVDAKEILTDDEKRRAHDANLQGEFLKNYKFPNNYNDKYKPNNYNDKYKPNILYLISLGLITYFSALLFINVINYIYYLITRTKKHVKHNSISKSLHKK